jgi:hypothetical protein
MAPSSFTAKTVPFDGADKAEMEQTAKNRLARKRAEKIKCGDEIEVNSFIALFWMLLC